jgi:hypothetical protein
MLFHVTVSKMANPTTNRVRKHRESLRAAGLRPVQIWVPDTNSETFRLRCERESLSLVGDPREAEFLDWIAEIGDTDGWV